VKREIGGPGAAGTNEQSIEAGQMRVVAGDEHIARFTNQSVANPLRRIVRL
jgi:hypothetical protein